MIIVNILLIVMLILFLGPLISKRIVRSSLFLAGGVLCLGSIGYFLGNAYFGHTLIFLGILSVIIFLGLGLMLGGKEMPSQKKLFGSGFFIMLFWGAVTLILKKNQAAFIIQNYDRDRFVSNQGVFVAVKEGSSFMALELMMILVFISFLCIHLIILKGKKKL